MTEATRAIPDSLEECRFGYGLDGHVALRAGSVRAVSALWQSADRTGADILSDGARSALRFADGTMYGLAADELTVDASGRIDDLIERDHNPVMACLLAVRGVPTFHGFVASTPKGSVTVMGPSGAGKTTTGLALLALGAELVADDIVAIDTHGAPLPARPHVRTVAAESEALDPGGKHRLAFDLSADIRPLRAALVLTEQGDAWAEVAAPMARTEHWLAQRYLPIPLSRTEEFARLSAVADLAENARVFTARQHALPADDLAARLLESL